MPPGPGTKVAEGLRDSRGRSGSSRPRAAVGYTAGRDARLGEGEKTNDERPGRAMVQPYG